MSNQKSKITYSDSGVDIDKANDLIDEIKPIIKETLTDDVLSNIGGFGGLFELSTKGIDRPVLVSGTDGVGTKVSWHKSLISLKGLGLIWLPCASMTSLLLVLNLYSFLIILQPQSLITHKQKES